MNSIIFEVRATLEDKELVEKKTAYYSKFLETYQLNNDEEKSFNANKFVIDSINYLVKKYGFLTPYQLCEIANTSMDLAVEIERTERKENETKETVN